jgi:hypothetical protein
MQKALIKGAKIGALTGFISTLAYAVMALIIVELYLPLPDPSIVVIFNKDFFHDLVFEIMFQTSIIWLPIPTLIGALTATGFALYMVKARPRKRKFIFRCTLACILVVSPFLFLTASRIIFVIFFNGVFHPLINPVIDTLLEVGFPSFVYIVAGYITSNYLYKNDTKEDDKYSAT